MQEADVNCQSNQTAESKLPNNQNSVNEQTNNASPLDTLYNVLPIECITNELKTKKYRVKRSQINNILERRIFPTIKNKSMDDFEIRYDVSYEAKEMDEVKQLNNAVITNKATNDRSI